VGSSERREDDSSKDQKTGLKASGRVTGQCSSFGFRWVTMLVPVEDRLTAWDAEITPVCWACQYPCTTYCSSITYPWRFFPKLTLDRKCLSGVAIGLSGLSAGRAGTGFLNVSGTLKRVNYPNAVQVWKRRKKSGEWVVFSLGNGRISIWKTNLHCEWQSERTFPRCTS
jgi:hypothetical protein